MTNRKGKTTGDPVKPYEDPRFIIPPGWTDDHLGMALRNTTTSPDHIMFVSMYRTTQHWVWAVHMIDRESGQDRIGALLREGDASTRLAAARKAELYLLFRVNKILPKDLS